MVLDRLFGMPASNCASRRYDENARLTAVIGSSLESVLLAAAATRRACFQTASNDTTHRRPVVDERRLHPLPSS